MKSKLVMLPDEGDSTDMTDTDTEKIFNLISGSGFYFKIDWLLLEHKNKGNPEQVDPDPNKE